ncbi:hypothetical protein MG293_020389, partial [Ovis ammon polii]
PDSHQSGMLLLLLEDRDEQTDSESEREKHMGEKSEMTTDWTEEQTPNLFIHVFKDHDKDMEMSKSTDSLQRKGYWTVLQKEYHAMCISMVIGDSYFQPQPQSNENENNAFVEEMSSWDGAVLRHQLNFSYNNNNYHNQCNQETYTLPLISYTRKGTQLDCDPYSFLSGPWT